jgi:hypothetical protein
MEVALAIIGSGALSVLISNLFSLYRDKRRIGTGVEAGVRQLLYDRIKFLCMRHIERGYITAGDLEDVLEMHKIYHDDLDGNGYLDSLIDRVKRLPIRAEVA